MKLIELMFSDSQTETAELLNEITCILSDLQTWDEMSESDKADLFGKLIGAGIETPSKG